MLASTHDDAAVYRLTPETALVQTVDFFTPVVDDPRAFGAIAAANAISDIYAMGAEPKFALNVAGFPKDFPMEILAEILLGGAGKAAEAGVVVVGGHTIDDPEPKYGLAVTGFVHPDRLVTKHALRPGDRLVLTKPLGTGVVGTAIKRGDPSPQAVEEAVRVMSTLNRAAARIMREHGIRAATDVTGFGLLGHLAEMLDGAGLAAGIRADAVPVMTEARRLVGMDVPAGTRANLARLRPRLSVSGGVSEDLLLLLADAQTSGGLLMGVPEEKLERLTADLAADPEVPAAAVIGSVEAGPAAGTIRIRP